MPPIADPDNLFILDAWFKAIDRTVTQAQADVIHRAVNAHPTVLHMQLCMLESKRWHSYTEEEQFEPIEEDSTEQLLNRIATRLEKRHGKVFVSHALSYICASRFGLSELELEDVLSLDDAVSSQKCVLLCLLVLCVLEFLFLFAYCLSFIFMP